MIISRDTKISELINAHPDCIEAIASINPHFQKLKNPLLRKILAGRVTISDAARIGKCSVDDFYSKLQPLGFKIKPENPGEKPLVNSDTKFKIPETHLIEELDVRPLLNSNKDPFNLIMKKLQALPAGSALLVINSFEPVPLLRILEQKGYNTIVKQINMDTFHCWIMPGTKNSPAAIQLPENNGDFETVFERYKDNLQKLDVRDLEMPKPMIKILKALDGLPAGKALFVLHKKIPVFLFPELRQRGFQWVYKQLSETKVDLLIYVP